jgi:fatty-acyl-CoA synthase
MLSPDSTPLPTQTLSSAHTLVESLTDLRHEHRRMATFIGGRGERRQLSFAELWDRSLRFAAGLRRRGLQTGEPVVLVLPEPEEALVAILGCMALGCPPAPVYPPMGARGVPAFLRYAEHVAQRARAQHMVVGSQIYPFVGSLLTGSAGLRGIDRFATLMDGVVPERPERVSPDDIAFLQFTSGSTAQPKGVMVTHRALLANLEMIHVSSRQNENSSVVTWLPVYHDMGLIGTVLNALHHKLPMTVLSPRTFLRSPRLWLEAIGEFKGTHTAAPNFAYGLCVKRISAEQRVGIDLSSMEVFICGAEPIQPETLERFVEHFAPCGLRAGAMVPAYGLAEATLAVTFAPHMTGMRTEVVDALALTAERQAVKVDKLPGVEEQRKLLRIPSCGRPLPGIEVRIADEQGRALAERHVGEIQLRGRSVTPGYIHDPAATNAARTADGWLKTGDLGYLADGELFPCGRIKDLIILRGKNYHAHDIEMIAGEVDGVRTGNVVAFSVAGAGSMPSREVEGLGDERLVLVAECKVSEEIARLEHDIRARLSEVLGVVPEEVVVVAPGVLPKTSSGKLRRAETKQRYLSNRLLDSKQDATSLHMFATMVRSGLGHAAGWARNAASFVTRKLPFGKP